MNFQSVFQYSLKKLEATCLSGLSSSYQSESKQIFSHLSKASLFQFHFMTSPGDQFHIFFAGRSWHLKIEERDGRQNENMKQHFWKIPFNELKNYEIVKITKIYKCLSD